jgi:cyclohexanone monooxygenase
MADGQLVPAADAERLRERYRRERDKRLRPEGNEQYIEAKGAFAHFLDDPYVQKPIRRAPLTDMVEVVVIGGGFGGLIAAGRLKQAGVAGVRVIEAGGDFGGTWYWNRYPGAACDIESYIYLPMLEETGYTPVERYSRAPEIFEYTKRLARHFGLYENACLQTAVTGLAWDEERACWIVSTNRGDAMRARFVVMSNGPLNKPKLPGLAGIERFKGRAFHTSRWDYDYTGGDVTGNLTKLADKRVGLIGTGATAVQCVPHLGAAAQHLYVFQRTPSAVDRRGDRATDEGWFAAQEPGWQARRMDNFNILVSGGFQPEDLVADGWTDAIRNIIHVASKAGNETLSPEALAALSEQADFKKMEAIRARIDGAVRDRTTAEALKPWYRQFCKRPCFHDAYLETFNRPTVTLVDTDGKGVEAITEAGVRANGRDYALDCLVYATGFEVGTRIDRRMGCQVRGRDGALLADAWADGARTLHGIMAPGFANLFFLGGPQGGFTANYPHNLQEQASHVAHIVTTCLARSARAVEPTARAAESWGDTIAATAQLIEAFQENCTPGYYNNEGQPAGINRRNGFYGAGSMAYFAILKAWRAEGDLAGLTLQ